MIRGQGRIPRYLDAPITILIWDVDVFVPAFAFSDRAVPHNLLLFLGLAGAYMYTITLYQKKISKRRKLMHHWGIIRYKAISCGFTSIHFVVDKEQYALSFVCRSPARLPCEIQSGHGLQPLLSVLLSWVMGYCVYRAEHARVIIVPTHLAAKVAIEGEASPELIRIMGIHLTICSIRIRPTTWGQIQRIFGLCLLRIGRRSKPRSSNVLIKWAS